MTGAVSVRFVYLPVYSIFYFGLLLSIACLSLLLLFSSSGFLSDFFHLSLC